MFVLIVGLTRAEDIDFGDPNTCTLQNKECQVDLKVDCQSELSGFIQTPNFPNNMISSQSGKVKKSRTEFHVFYCIRNLFLTIVLVPTNNFIV